MKPEKWKLHLELIRVSLDKRDGTGKMEVMTYNLSRSCLVPSQIHLSYIV